MKPPLLSGTLKKTVIDDIDYPENLRAIHRPPEALYVFGSLDERDRYAIAVVGSRRATQYGLDVAQRLSYELAARGVTVVSGMARGIDGAAHKGALKAGGRTIAVMGSGHGYIYPPEHKELYARIGLSGAVITEFRDDVEPLPYNFPQRNRIISGLSLGVVVVEAARNSGALITADLALDQGREVFAVPGKISSHSSGGTHELIKQGAKLVASADDILEEISAAGIPERGGNVRRTREADIEKKTQAYVYNALSMRERAVYKVLSDEAIYIDCVIEKSGLGRSDCHLALTALQLKKLAHELPGKLFVKTAR